MTNDPDCNRPDLANSNLPSGNQGSAYALTLTNPSTALRGIALADTIYPVGLTGLGAVSGSCGGTRPIDLLTRTIVAAGASLSGGASCMMTFGFSSTKAGSYSLTTGGVSATGTATRAGVTVAAPLVASASPPTITGTNLTGISAITINSVPVSFTHVSDTRLTLITPPNVAGPLNLEVSHAVTPWDTLLAKTLISIYKST